MKRLVAVALFVGLTLGAALPTAAAGTLFGAHVSRTNPRSDSKQKFDSGYGYGTSVELTSTPMWSLRTSASLIWLETQQKLQDQGERSRWRFYQLELDLLRYIGPGRGSRMFLLGGVSYQFNDVALSSMGSSDWGTTAGVGIRLMGGAGSGINMIAQYEWIEDERFALFTLTAFKIH